MKLQPKVFHFENCDLDYEIMMMMVMVMMAMIIIVMILLTLCIWETPKQLNKYFCKQ